MRAKYRHLASSLGVGIEVPAGASRAPFRSLVHDDALSRASDETGVHLDGSRVRVGLTRGHLLEVVVQVPLDVAGDAEALQVASELYCEARVGEALLDEWVASIAVDRIARAKGMLTVLDVASPAASHALEDVEMLIRRGVDGVRAALPASLLRADFEPEGWTALDIPEADSMLQSDRRHASTLFPEALKCVLEGLPFSSSRFTLGPEAFVWWCFESRDDAQVRLQRRSVVEGELLRAPDLFFCGSGFGRSSDYFDAWVDLEHPDLPGLLRRMAGEYGPYEFGVYDSSCCDHPLQLGP